jgi:four helix bundle protein
MNEKALELSERFLEYDARVIGICRKLEGSFIGRRICGQLFDAATSAGANYEEACSGESRKDFIHKMKIVLKELNESRFWLRLTLKAKMLQNDEKELKYLIDETTQLAKIIATSLVTAQNRKK